MKQTLTLTWVFLLVALIAGCASSQLGDVYSRADAQGAHRVQYGTIKALRPIRIEGTKSGVGSIAGGIAGGIAGSAVGHGAGSDVMAVIGAVAGGMIGAATEEGVTRVNGVEFTIDLENSGTVSVAQEVDPKQIYRVGDRVKLIYAPDRVRVAPVQGG